MTEKLIGFKCGEMEKDFLETWDLQRRKLYLLSDKISKPLSVDNSVWENAIEVENPNIYGLWKDLSLLNRKTEKINFDLWRAAVTILLSDQNQSREPLIESIVTNPENMQNLSTDFLGYDVADDALTSGLMNCGYTEPDEKMDWASQINEYHLFSSRDAAIKFKTYSDKRIPEHAPFRVFGIYKLNNW
ncbi:MAG TPA: hypothetical protein VK957_04545 [Lunatimonas sp.]|nr:hypothetical protein [Lunatimonas sp.]